MQLNVYINRVADVNLFRLVGWKVRLLSILLNPSNRTVGVSRLTVCAGDVIGDGANYALQRTHTVKHMLLT